MKKFELCCDRDNKISPVDTILIDWLEFTIDGTVLDFDLLSDFGISSDTYTLLPHGRNGYTTVYKFCDSCYVMISPDRPDMGIHYVFPSSGLRYIFTDISKFYLLQCAFRDRNFRVTRLDIAFDIFNQPYTPQYWYNLFQSGNCVTRSKKYMYISSDTGSTFSVGSRGGYRYLRIYDKMAEQCSSGHSDVYSDTVTSHIRWEVEYRSIYANHVFNHICMRHSVRDFCDLLGSFVRFDVPEYYQMFQFMEKITFPLRKSNFERSFYYFVEKLLPYASACFSLLDDSFYDIKTLASTYFSSHGIDINIITKGDYHYVI